MSLPHTLDFDLPLDIADMDFDPLSVARRAMERLYNAMGQRTSPHFDANGKLSAAVAKSLPGPLFTSLQ
jgi:hypothetical protein